MYAYIRKNQKKVMAILGVILMIAFIIPTGIRATRPDMEHVVGQIGSEKIYREQIQAAEDEWRFIAETVLQRNPAAAVDSQQSQWASILTMLPEQIVRPIERQPETYFLLQAEARQMGLSPNLAEAEQFLSGETAGIRYQGRVMSLADLSQVDPRFAEQTKRAVAELLMVLSAFDRAVQAVKLSAPLVEHELAASMQQIKLNIVDFSAADFEASVPEPTEQQLQEQFQRYADVLPGATPTEANPFGFGYKLPNRVKLQYIAIPRQQVRQAVRATKSDYDWEVEAYKYYLRYPERFPATQPQSPTTTSTDAFTLGGGSAPTTAAAPTTQPFEQVRDEIITTLLEPQIDKLQRQIQNEILQKLNQGYEAYRAATTTAPATAPQSATRPAGYESFQFLQDLARQIEQKYNVTPTVAAINEYKGPLELRLLPGIGQASLFADFAMFAEPFVPPDQRDQPAVLSLYEPSKPLPDDAGNVYIFRLTDAVPAQRPGSIEPVREQVVADWKKARAFEAARAAAQQLLEAARQHAAGLAAAAVDRKLITTGAFSLNEPVPNYPLSSRSQAKLGLEAHALLGAIARAASTTAPATQPLQRPMGLVELPADGKVAVIELVEVRSDLKPEIAELARLRAASGLRQAYQQLMLSDWFTYEAVAARLGYIDHTGRAGRSTRGRPSPQPAESPLAPPPPAMPLSALRQ
ncbi:hypothetical protein [Fontivita pretiosa]|uniref:hypothetical protein n=1 Tax=Fontivita pretiosa TaxID=2989684 RepID=UPI003D1695F7